MRVRYLHSDIDTLRRVELLRELRLGEFDVLVGINLLREGLDLPEVSLVSILDADKEGFLRSTRSLIQTIGRAARNVSGQVHMYADNLTPRCRRPSRRLPASGNRSRTTWPTASIRSRCARRSRTSPTCSSARTPTPSSCSARSGPLTRQGRRWSRRRGAMAADVATVGTDRIGDLPAAELREPHPGTDHPDASGRRRPALRTRCQTGDEIGDLKKELRQMSEATR